MKYESSQIIKDFSNIEILYEPRLHAIYYATGNSGLISCLNLHEPSQNENFEIGVLTKTNLIGSGIVGDAYNNFQD